jgi:hypothetical protein
MPGTSQYACQTSWYHLTHWRVLQPAAQRQLVFVRIWRAASQRHSTGVWSGLNGWLRRYVKPAGTTDELAGRHQLCDSCWTLHWRATRAVRSFASSPSPQNASSMENGCNDISDAALYIGGWTTPPYMRSQIDAVSVRT